MIFYILKIGNHYDITSEILPNNMLFDNKEKAMEQMYILASEYEAYIVIEEVELNSSERKFDKTNYIGIPDFHYFKKEFGIEQFKKLYNLFVKELKESGKFDTLDYLEECENLLYQYKMCIWTKISELIDKPENKDKLDYYIQEQAKLLVCKPIFDFEKQTCGLTP